MTSDRPAMQTAPRLRWLAAAAVLYVLPVAACGGDDGGDGAGDPVADEAYVRDFCGAFSEFFEEIGEQARPPAQALPDFAVKLERTTPPRDFANAHEGYVKVVRAAVEDPRQLTTVGEVPRANEKTEARLKTVAAGIPECRELGIFQR